MAPQLDGHKKQKNTKLSQMVISCMYSYTQTGQVNCVKVDLCHHRLASKQKTVKLL